MEIRYKVIWIWEAGKKRANETKGYWSTKRDMKDLERVWQFSTKRDKSDALKQVEAKVTNDVLLADNIKKMQEVTSPTQKRFKVGKVSISKWMKTYTFDIEQITAYPKSNWHLFKNHKQN